jgi:hypothetical protein
MVAASTVILSRSKAIRVDVGIGQRPEDLAAGVVPRRGVKQLVGQLLNPFEA